MAAATSSLYAQAFETANNIFGADNQEDKVLNINGYGRGSVYGGGESFDFASAFSEISLQPSLEKQGAFLKSDLRFRTGYFFNENNTELQVKELYAGYKHDNISVLLGN
jgi:hypothetical protein